MRIGTPYFVSRAAAMRYYRKYNKGRFRRPYLELANWVADKIVRGEIHIGQPKPQKGERVVLIDEGTRYAVETETP